MNAVVACDGHDGESIEDEGICDLVATRIFHGDCGHIVLTVQATTPEQTRMLARVSAAGLEAALLRVYGGRLERL